jgi:pilus assembly protein Flp/PilA
LRCGQAPRGSTDNFRSRSGSIKPGAPPRRCQRTTQGVQHQEDAMNALVNFVKTVSRKDEGQDLLEYALLVALIAIVAVGAVTTAGTTVQGIFQNIAGQI